jgi:predicted AlkP superfamily pyrophosphatase or phosphodiesterase
MTCGLPACTEFHIPLTFPVFTCSKHFSRTGETLVREKRIPAAMFFIAAVVLIAGMLFSHAVAQTAQKPAGKEADSRRAPAPVVGRRNVILFVTDGLRHDSVTPETAPNIFSLRQQGVDFINSHSLYPTFTTPNASAFATGHGLGDTGDFGNGMYIGGPLQDPQNDSKATIAPFIESDLILGEINRRFNGNFLTEQTLMDLARKNGYAVATVGKLGPTAIQDISQVALATVSGKPGELQLPQDAIILDDATGREGNKKKLGFPLPADLEADMKSVGLAAMTPDRANGQKGSQQDNSVSGNLNTPGTLGPNRIQQQYFADAVTQAILPRMAATRKPFFIVFWSRDPDGTQHNQGDSLNQLSPGINGPSSRAAIHNADANLGQIINYLKAANLYANTDIVVVADHGFSTISKNKVGSDQVTNSYSSTRVYDDVKPGYLPPGFLAIDLAHGLQENLYDPDGAIDQKTHTYPCVMGGAGDSAKECPQTARHPSNGSGVIGGSGGAVLGEKTDARIIVAANGGSDLIYLPGTANGPKTQADREFAKHVAEILLKQDYVDGVFVDDAFGDIPGALRLSNIGLKGAHPSTPVPAMMVNFKSFSLDSQTPQLARLTRVEIADGTLQEGQGMHGSFSRADTFNNLVAAGPDFKAHYIDRAPVSNADVAMTLAEVMRLPMPMTGSKLQGRVAKESLSVGKPPAEYSGKVLEMVSPEGPGGAKTMLLFQEYQGHYYYDQACLLRTETTCK